MDDELNVRFSAFEADILRTVRVPPSGRVRVAGDRRRTRMAAGVAAVSVGLTMSAGGAVAVALLPPGAGQPPATRPPVTTFPPGLLMVHDGEPGWHGNADLLAPGALRPCAGEDPTLAGRTDARTTTGPSDAQTMTHSPTTYTEQALVFIDDTAARTAFGKLRSIPAACGWSSPSIQSIGVHDKFDASDLRLTGAPQQLGVEAALRGNAVILIHWRATGALMTGSDPGGLERLAALVCTGLGACGTGPDGTGSPSPSVAGSPSPPVTGSPATGSPGPSGSRR